MSESVFRAVRPIVFTALAAKAGVKLPVYEDNSAKIISAFDGDAKTLKTFSLSFFTGNESVART
jgi:hypothetical protein